MLEKLLNQLDKLESKDVVTKKDQKEIDKLKRQIARLEKNENKHNKK